MATAPGTRSPKFSWSFRIATLQLLSFSLLFLGVHGGWSDPAYEILPNLPEGIKLEGQRLFLPENVATGGDLPLLVLNVDDSDKVIKQSPPYPSFYVTSDTDEDSKTRWHFNVNETFDFETASDVTYLVVLNLEGQSSPPEYLQVEIVDVNDNSPVFESQDPDPLDPVKEAEMVTEPILTIIATDADVADNDNLLYELTEYGIESANFRVNSETGQVFMKKELDYVARSIHRLNIKISDRREPYFSTYANVTVIVEDIPNIPPVFTKAPLINAVEEKTAIGTTIIEVEARDGDYGLNFDIEYALEDELGYFTIDKTSGVITVAKEIDADTDEVLIGKGWTYTFTVIANEVNYDEGLYPDLPIEYTQTKTAVSFAIQDINDQEPLICNKKEQEITECQKEVNYEFKINETDLQVTLPNDLVIRVVDLDATTAYSRYSAAIETNDEIISRAFSISPDRGMGEEEFFILIKDPTAIDFENGEWHDPKKFRIVFTGDDQTHQAFANIEVTVIDVNDNSPVFSENTYTFKVCENTPDGTPLKNKLPNDPEYPNSCRDSVEQDFIVVSADDDDISDSYGKPSIRYMWSGREPPILLDWEKGTMTMQKGSSIGFDYERLKEEIYIVQAVDELGEGRSTTATVVFEILDRNDVPVNLRFANGYRTTINENDTSVDPILEGITAEDDDENGDIVCSMTVTEIFTALGVLLENGTFTSQYKQLNMNNDIKADISKWFALEVLPGGTDKFKEFKLILAGDELPDRDPPGQDVIDRVELNITCNDLNSETEEENTQLVFQLVTINIDDINDNPPEWRDEESDNFTGIVTETEFDDPVDDTSTDRQREIYQLTVTDRDRNPTFFFSLSNEDCELAEDICSNIRDMFELSNEQSSGYTILRRRKGKQIDRDDRNYFLDDNDILNITVVVSDEEKEDPYHQIKAKFQIKVEDRNDHTPEFTDDYHLKQYFVNEDANNEEIITIEATDEDHPDAFGKVSYILIDGETSNGTDKFDIHEDTGRITAKDGCCEWFEGSMYRVEVKAIDYYRPTSPSGSNSATTFVHISVIDKNNNAPEFLTRGGDTPENPLVDKLETTPDTSEALTTILIQDKDNPALPNGNFAVDIEEVTRDPATSDDLKRLFKLELAKDGVNNIRELKVFPTQNFTGLWGNYTITFKAIDGNDDVGQNPAKAPYVFRIRNENINAPEFIYPAKDELSVLISIENSEPGKELVNLRDNQPARAVEAEDKDKGSGENGEFVFSMESDDVCKELFQLHEETGVISLKIKPDIIQHANKRCNLKITATDKGLNPNETPAELLYILLNDRNTDPAFSQRLMYVHMLENCSESPSTLFDPSIDEDKENENCFEFNSYYCDIHYFLKGGDSDMFNLKETEFGLQLELKDGQKIDRETKDTYDVCIYATNVEDEEVEDKEPQDVLDGDNDQWAVIRIIVDDRLDTPPKFDGLSNGILTSGFTTRVQTDALIGEVKATDGDINDRVTFRISSDFTVSPGLPVVNPALPPFELVPSENKLNTADIKLKFDPQPNYKGHYTFQITAMDSVGETAKVQCQVYIVADKNVVNFYFTSPTLDDMKKRQDELSGILSNAFNYSCNVDRVFVNAAGSNGAITVETHFVNVENNQPVISDYIEAQQFKPAFYREFVDTLSENGFALQRIGESDEIPESDVGQIVTFVLIGGVAVLTISLLILAATCFYNQKSLKLRVRALTANTFGSQQSDLNRLGMANEAPNTNAFAVEGSNPVWTVDADRRKIPEFDTDSVGSGGSVLIGAEDEDYFQKSSKNPMFQGVDVLANYESDNDISDGRSYNKAEPDYAEDNNSLDSNNMNESPFTSKITRNPLMNFGEGQQSIDVDEDFGDEPFQFEANTDGGLF